MAISAGPAEGTIRRGRGGFLCNTQDVPFVTDPTGAVVKGGARKGEPKRLAYGNNARSHITLGLLRRTSAPAA